MLRAAIAALFKPYLSKQARSCEFLGRDGFDYGSPFVGLNCLLVFLSLQGQAAGSTGRT